MMYNCKNGKTLCISEISNINLIKEMPLYSPNVVLLSAQKVNENEFVFYKNILETLDLHQIAYIVCVGSNAEDLHDAIDEWLSEKHEYDATYPNIVTTFHDADEPREDIAAFVLEGALTENNEGGNIFAILDSQHSQDVELRDILVAGCS